MIIITVDFVRFKIIITVDNALPTLQQFLADAQGGASAGLAVGFVSDVQKYISVLPVVRQVADGVGVSRMRGGYDDGVAGAYTARVGRYVAGVGFTPAPPYNPAVFLVLDIYYRRIAFVIAGGVASVVIGLPGKPLAEGGQRNG